MRCEPSFENFPEDAPGTKCFLSEREARKHQCDENENKFVFGKQGVWRGGKKPIPDKNDNDSVPNNSIVGKDSRYHFDYVAVVGDWYVSGNWHDGIPDAYITICRRPNPAEDALLEIDWQGADQVRPIAAFPNEIWCATCTKKCPKKLQENAGK